MTNIVIDTNVVISALLSPTGNASKILSLISLNNSIRVFYSVEILDEYKRVLAYKRLNIAIKKQKSTIAKFIKFGNLVEPPVSTISMSDETDRTFYDTVKLIGGILITGNMKHYPSEPFIMLPKEFITMFLLKM